jgi:hypothetical protein
MQATLSVAVLLGLLLLPSGAVAQDEPTRVCTEVTVPPGSQLEGDVALLGQPADGECDVVVYLPLVLADNVMALAPSTSTPDAPPAAGDVVAIKGIGDISGSKPFDLDGGDYEVTLDTKGDCDVSGWYLKRTEDDQAIESFEQSGYMYAVDAGRHFIKVIAGDKCQWTMTITPLAE